MYDIPHYSSGVDYVTFTARQDDDTKLTLEAIFDALRFSDELQNRDENPARYLGFEGTEVSTMFWGYRPRQGKELFGWHMLRISGPLANSAVHTCSALGAMAHVTRMDCQITRRWKRDVPNQAAIELAKHENFVITEKLKRPPKIVYIDGRGDGDTLNIGRRTSEIYFRVYDKSRESDELFAPWRWRHEVELKGTHANEALRYLMDKRNTPEAAATVVNTYAARWGLEHWGDDNQDFDIVTVPRIDVDDYRRLDWLRTTVAPTVQKLRLNYGDEEVLTALGLHVIMSE